MLFLTKQHALRNFRMDVSSYKRIKSSLEELNIAMIKIKRRNSSLI